MSSYDGHALLPCINDGNGNFGPVAALNAHASSQWPNTCKIADLNRDGQADLISSGSGGGLSVWIGTGGGAFADPIYVATGSGPHGVEVADMDRDGNADLVFPNRDSGTVMVRYGNGTGTAFPVSRTLTVGAGPLGATVADMNRDGLPDIVSGDSGSAKASVYLNAGKRTFFQQPDIALPAAPFRGPCVVDFNRDGVPDVIQALPDPGQVAIVRGAPTTTPGTLSGTVMVGGHPQNGVTVQVDSLPEFYTTPDGTYSVPLLTPGTHTVTFSRTNYTTVMFDDVVITENQTTIKDVVMVFAPVPFYGTVREQGTANPLAGVTVTWEASPLP